MPISTSYAGFSRFDRRLGEHCPCGGRLQAVLRSNSADANQDHNSDTDCHDLFLLTVEFGAARCRGRLGRAAKLVKRLTPTRVHRVDLPRSNVAMITAEAF